MPLPSIQINGFIIERNGMIWSNKIANRRNIKKNLESSDVVYEIASDETAKKKAIQVALKVMFRLRKEKSDKNLKVEIASIDELKQSQFKEWFEVEN